ncbi:MAG: hypothetical protein KF881_04300 [Acidobacteria bacterium]|nr:hypothetical protein [Acidobacteriota bacterium]
MKIAPCYNVIGGEAKRSQRVWDGEQEQWEDWDHVYFISSSVTGSVVSEATKTGKKRYTYVAAGGRTIARQEVTATNTQSAGSLPMPRQGCTSPRVIKGDSERPAPTKKPHASSTRVLSV